MSPDWPVAYPGVPLAKHLTLVARASQSLFTEDLTVLRRRYSVIDLEAVLTGAALLHDVGKASYYYKEKMKSPGRISFYLHEAVWSLVVYSVARRAIDETRDERTFNYLDLVARVIARHHAAMECRHPIDLVRHCRKEVYILREVLKGLDADTVAGLLAGLDGVASGLGVPAAAWGLLKDRDLLKEASNMAVKYAERDIVSLASTTSSPPPVGPIVGMLIVADVMVASFLECRTSDDRMAPAYALHWRSELAGRLPRLGGIRACEENVRPPKYG